MFTSVCSCKFSDETIVNVGSKACNKSKDGKKDILLCRAIAKLLQKKKWLSCSL